MNQEQRPIVLVTGSDGLLGSTIIPMLQQEFHVVGLDNNRRPERLPEIDWHLCDLTDDEQVARAFDEVRTQYGTRIASVIHLAAYYDFSGEPSSLYDELTINGTRRILDQLQSFEVEQFLFTSSLLVMKPCEPGQQIDESAPVHGKWEYPKSKIAVEKMLESQSDMRVTILRVAGVYDENCSSIPIAHQMVRIYEESLESHVFPGDLEHGQSFVHRLDAGKAIVNAVRHRNDLGQHEVFLLGEPEVVSYGEMQDLIGQSLWGTNWRTLPIPKVIAKGGAWIKEQFDKDQFIKPWMIELADDHYEIDISKAARMLHWQPHHRLRDVVPEMARRLREDPAEWYARNGLGLPEKVGS